MPNPIKPGHIHGQNPNIPERLPEHTRRRWNNGGGAGLVFAAIAALIGVVLFISISMTSHAADTATAQDSTPASDLMQTLAYFFGAVLLGGVIVYGIMRSRSGAPSIETHVGVKRIYRQEEDERREKEARANHSPGIVDEIERKTDTTG
jgi:amino acid transporter